MSHSIEETVAKTVGVLNKIDAYRQEVDMAFSWVEKELQKDNSQEKKAALESAKNKLNLTKEFLNKEEELFKKTLKDKDFGIILEVAQFVRKF